MSPRVSGVYIDPNERALTLVRIQAPAQAQMRPVHVSNRADEPCARCVEWRGSICRYISLFVATMRSLQALLPTAAMGSIPLLFAQPLGTGLRGR